MNATEERHLRTNIHSIAVSLAEIAALAREIRKDRNDISKKEEASKLFEYTDLRKFEDDLK